MKTTKTFTIEHDVYEAARQTGANLSEIVEQALVTFVNYHKEQPHLFGIFTDSDKDIEFMNKMIHRCSEAFPGFCKRWTEIIKAKYGFEINYYELHKLCRELINTNKNCDP